MWFDQDDISYMNPTPSNSFLGWWMLFLIAIVLFLLGAAFIASEQQRQWTQFKRDNNCRAVAASNNHVEWMCADGNVYTR